MNVTYWFGAGASAQALPVISNFEEKITESKKLLRNIFPRRMISVNGSGDRGPDIISKIINSCYDPLIEYVKDSQKFTTIDTLSKYYMVSNPYKFEYYKRLLKTFFLIEDCIVNKVDGRYLGLIASISENHVISQKINFITWNYDNQLYKARSIFGGKPFVIPNWGIESDEFGESTSVVYYLNGSSYDDEICRDGFDLNGLKGDKNKAVDRILQGLHPTEPTSIRYAFEENEAVDDLISHLSKRLKHTKVLVIVGYSFPYFNRFIDTEILKYCVGLEKIYVQDANPEPVIERLQQLSKGLWEENDYGIREMINLDRQVINGSVKYEIVNNLNAFHIPVELD